MRINEINCVGCSACKHICSKEAINISQDEFGFYKATIDKQKCIECGLCYKNCPLIKFSKYKKPTYCYAVWDLDESSRKKSTSGGFASVAAKKIVKDGGVAFLCSSKIDNGRINHIRIDNVENVDTCRGSKYVQSFTGNTFKNCKKELENGTNCLYIGTPCQISGLKNYLSKEYSNLLTIDLICHGVPSIDFLKKHLNEKFIDGLSIGFRDKNGFNLSLYSNDNCLYYKNEWNDLYYIAFNCGILFNDDCLKCNYATPERVGDISIGDFWGLGKTKPFDENIKYGCSVVVCNSEKGISFLNDLKEILFIEKREYKEAIFGNHNLSKASISKYDKHNFEMLYKKYGFDKTILKLCKKDIVKGLIITKLNNTKIGNVLLDKYSKLKNNIKG